MRIGTTQSLILVVFLTTIPPTYIFGFESASNRFEYQEYFVGVKATGA